MGQKKDRSILTLSLWVALATAPMATALLTPKAIQAQSGAPSTTVTESTEQTEAVTVRIDGSPNMTQINTLLQQRYREQQPDADLEISTSGTEAALKALLDGNIDVAAIGRSLTAEETARGLVEVPLYREKIAIVVGEDNPFADSITSGQFARIFRGEITDWSEVGGQPGRIRVIDRPENSDLRQAFRNYPVFREAQFASGETATFLESDDTDEMIRQLGKDGIGYAIFSQVKDRSDVQIVAMHKTLPDDARYPFSEPFSYVHKADPSPETRAFVDFVSNPTEQQTLAEAIASGVAVAPSATLTPDTPEAETPDAAADAEAETDTPEAETPEVAADAEAETDTSEAETPEVAADAEADGESQDNASADNPDTTSEETATANADTEATPPATGEIATNAIASEEGETTAAATDATDSANGRSKPFWLLLLPLGLAGGALWWMMKDSQEAAQESNYTPTETVGPDDAPSNGTGAIDAATPIAADPDVSTANATSNLTSAVGAGLATAAAGAALSDEDDRAEMSTEDPTEDETPTAVANETSTDGFIEEDTPSDTNENGATNGLSGVGAGLGAALAGGAAGVGAALSNAGDRLEASVDATRDALSGTGGTSDTPDLEKMADASGTTTTDADAEEEEADAGMSLKGAALAGGAALAAGAAAVGSKLLGDRESTEAIDDPDDPSLGETPDGEMPDAEDSSNRLSGAIATDIEDESIPEVDAIDTPLMEDGTIAPETEVETPAATPVVDDERGISSAVAAGGAALAAGAAAVGSKLLGDREENREDAGDVPEDTPEPVSGGSNTVFPGEVFVNLADFDTGIRQLLPGYEEMLNAIVLGVPTDCRRILDLGTGTGALSLKLLERCPDAQIVGVDYSPRMLRFAQAKIDAAEYDRRWTGVEADFGELAKGATVPEVEEKFDACVSSFAIHHLEDEMKQQLYQWVARHLVEGGYFWNADPMLAESPALAEKYKALREEFARQNGIDLEAVRAKMGQSILQGYSGPDRLATLTRHLEMMTEAGLTSFSVPWKFYGFAVFGGRV